MVFGDNGHIRINNNYHGKFLLHITEFNGLFQLVPFVYLSLSFMRVYNLKIERTTYFSAIERVR